MQDVHAGEPSVCFPGPPILRTLMPSNLPGNMNMNRMQASMQAAHHPALQQGKDGMQNLHLNVGQGLAMHGGMHPHQQHPHLAAGAGIHPYGTPLQSLGAPAWRAADGGVKPKNQNIGPGAYAGANGSIRPQDHVGHMRSGAQPSTRAEEQAPAPQVFPFAVELRLTCARS